MTQSCFLTSHLPLRYSRAWVVLGWVCFFLAWFDDLWGCIFFLGFVSVGHAIQAR